MTNGPDQRELLDRLKIDRADEDEDHSGRWLIIGFGALCVLLVAGVLFLFWPVGSAGTDASNADAPPASETPAATTTTGAAPAPVAAGVLSASGYVTARRLATVSAEITGRVSEVMVEEGMTVEAGQVLARLDPTLANIDVSQAVAGVTTARGALLAAQADRAEAERVLARIKGISSDFASKADTTRASAALEAASARLTQAQGALASAEQTLARSRALLAKHEVRAPFAGVITSKDAQPGEIISPAAAGGGFTRTGICTIVDMNSLEVEVEVNEAFISRVRPGQRASATLDAYPELDIPAKVSAIIPTANRDKATVKVRVAITKGDPRILPEMAAKVSFYDDDKPALPSAPPSPQGAAPAPKGP